MAITLLDWISDLLRDPGARDDFQRDPDRYAEDHGFGHLSDADVRDALSLIADDHHYSRGYHYPAPHNDQDNHESGAHYLRTYIRDNGDLFGHNHTDVDNSVHQDIDSGDHGRDGDYNWSRYDHGWDHHGGDFHQVIDNDPVVAPGDGAVAAGDDIHDNVVTSGSHNLVGYNNEAATGDHNTTAFGSGDAAHADLAHTGIGDGGTTAVRGSAYGHSTDNDTNTSVHSSGSGSSSVNTAGDHGYANHYSDQHESNDSMHTSYEDHTDTDSHDGLNSNNDSHFADSHDYDVHHV